MNGWTLLAALSVGSAVLAGVAVASPNEVPLAEAGLDQTVRNGTTVYLDAGGSVDPDGSVDGVRWTITAPGGTTVTSTCDTCTRTQFTPTRAGEYAATVAVTDDAGATRNDTLYVTVERTSGPSVSLMGPSRTTRDESTTFGVAATADDAELDQLHLFRNGSRRQTIDLSGDNATLTVNRTFATTGTYRLRATVEDRLGYADVARQSVRVVSEGSGGGSGSWESFERCPDGGHPIYSDDGSHQTGCRQTAFTTTNDRILDLGSGNNPESVRWRDSDGTLYTMDRDQKEELVGNDGLLEISQMKEQGEEHTLSQDITTDYEHTNPDPRWQSDTSSSGSSNSPSDTSSSNSRGYNSGPPSEPGINSSCPAPCEDLSKLM